MLEKIKTTVCPKCGRTQIKSIVKQNQHCSGNWNESLEFDCGYKEVYSPNGGGVKARGECMFHKSYKIKQNKQKLAYSKLVKYIKRLDIDQELIARLLRSIEYII